MSDSPRNSRRNRLFLFGAVASLAGALVIGSAVASDGWSPGSCDREWTAEEARAKADVVAGRVLGRVDATDEQRDAVDTILDEAVPRLVVARAANKQDREAWKAALTAETVDRAALEELRSAALESAEEMSEAGLDVVVDLAEVLDADQRSELVEFAETFTGRHGRSR